MTQSTIDALRADSQLYHRMAREYLEQAEELDARGDVETSQEMAKRCVQYTNMAQKADAELAKAEGKPYPPNYSYDVRPYNASWEYHREEYGTPSGL